MKKSKVTTPNAKAIGLLGLKARTVKSPFKLKKDGLKLRFDAIKIKKHIYGYSATLMWNGEETSVIKRNFVLDHDGHFLLTGLCGYVDCEINSDTYDCTIRESVVKKWLSR